MQVTHKIKIHLDDQRLMPPIDVMQGDAYTRQLEFSLYSGGEKWEVPEGVSVAVAYNGSSGRGLYDTLPDGSKAYNVDGSTVTVTLIPQVAAVHGKTTISVVFTDDAGKQLATFGVELRAAPNPAVGAGEPAHYYNLREWASTPLCIELLHSTDGMWAADQGYDTILQEYESGRQVLCCLEQQDHQWLELPLVKEAAGVFTFGAIIDRTEWVVTIAPGEVKCESFQLVRADDLKAAATDEIYFDITEDGVVSLKPEYRGASTSTSADMVNSVSDNGYGLAGSKNRDLPEEIVIPESVGGTAVTAYAVGMFYKNSRLKKITLLGSVTAIPKAFCNNCTNLGQIIGTERVTSIGMTGFSYTAITEARFPAVTDLNASGAQFQGCANLMVAELGGALVEIPKNCFSACEKLASLEGCENVTTLGKAALFFTKRLKEIPFRGKLVTISQDALFLSRADWGTSEGFISGNIVPAYNGETKFTRIYSTFEQHDPRWQNKYIMKNTGGATRQYTDGCAYVSAAVVYSALKKKEFNSPEDFIAEVFEAHPELAQEDAGGDHTLTHLEHLVEAMMGYPGTLYRSVTTDSIQAVYDALSTGALVIAGITGDNVRASDGTLNSTNHAVVFYGITAEGEVMVVDSSAASRGVGIYEASVYVMPIQNLCRATDYFMIVPKPV